MKNTKQWFLLALLILIALNFTPAFADQCATSCNATDPLEVAQCMIECE